MLASPLTIDDNNFWSAQEIVETIEAPSHSIQSAPHKKDKILEIIRISQGVRAFLADNLDQATNQRTQYATNLDDRLLRKLEAEKDEIIQKVETMRAANSEQILPMIEVLIEGFTHCALHLAESSKACFKTIEDLGRLQKSIVEASKPTDIRDGGNIIHVDFQKAH